MAAFSVVLLHSRTINLTCCFSAAVFGHLLTEEPASASGEETTSEAGTVEFSLTVLTFLLLDLLDAETVDRCDI